MLALVACETIEPMPTPTVPAPPEPADAGPPPVDAPSPEVAANLNCHANGPKEWIEIQTDPQTHRGMLHRMTVGPVPTRRIHYTVRPDGLLAVDLVFDRYDKDDYQRWRNAKPAQPREKLVRGKSVVARVFVEDGRSHIVGVDVDLHTGMWVQRADHSYPCDNHGTGTPP